MGAGGRVQPRGRAACLRHNNTIHWVQTWVLTPLWQHTMGLPGIDTASLILLVQGSVCPNAGESVGIVPGRQDGRREVKGKERENSVSVSSEGEGWGNRGGWLGNGMGAGYPMALDLGKRKEKNPQKRRRG